MCLLSHISLLRRTSMSIKHYIIEDNFWKSIDDLFLSERFPGIYRLHATDSHGNFIPLSRALGVDPNGILYIGTSEVIQDRAANLKKSVCAAYKIIDPAKYGNLIYGDIGSHQTGKKIVKIPKFVEHFPLSGLCLTVERYLGAANDLKTKDYGHFVLEKQLLQDYERKYGEKPPLNS